MANAIHLIQPYYDRGIWMFDDEAKDIKREALVAGIPEMIEHFTETLEIPKPKKGFNLLFSNTEMPETHAHLTLLKKEGKGTWYALKGSDMVGWLCPVLYAYFKTPPKNLYVRFMPMIRKAAA